MLWNAEVPGGENSTVDFVTETVQPAYNGLQNRRVTAERHIWNVFYEDRPGSDSLDCIIMDESAGLEIVQACDAEAFRELVIYAPPNRPAVCMEPYTCTTDAINLEQRGIDAGWRVLEPGQMFEAWISISARKVYA